MSIAWTLTLCGIALALVALGLVREEGLMTRKGARQRSWSNADLSYLYLNLGKKPVKEIAKRLKRSEKSVYRKADRIRRNEISLSWCSSCNSLRTIVDRKGKCRICNLRESTERTEKESRKLIERLDKETRENYLKNEPLRGSKREDLAEKLSIIKQIKADKGFLVREEILELAYETRRYNAARSRLRHIREDLGISPRKNM